MEIYTTKDYNKFQVIVANREINKEHVRKLARSIKKKNLLFVRPLIVNDKMQLIDGQHRLAACEQIGETVFYIKAGGLTKEDIAVLNTAQKNWTRLDFINFFAIEGIKEFKDISRLINKYPEVKVSHILQFAGECKHLREGKLSPNIERATALCDTIQQIHKKGYPFVAKRDFCRALLETIADQPVNYKKLLVKILAESDALRECLSKVEYKTLLRKILN
jgi:hypothetical protein